MRTLEAGHSIACDGLGKQIKLCLTRQRVYKKHYEQKFPKTKRTRKRP